MEKIELTHEELDILQTIMSFINTHEAWYPSHNRDTLMKCEILLNKEELNFDLLKNVESKLYPETKKVSPTVTLKTANVECSTEKTYEKKTGLKI
jgi:hypothetical protein